MKSNNALKPYMSSRCRIYQRSIQFWHRHGSFNRTVRCRVLYPLSSRLRSSPRTAGPTFCIAHSISLPQPHTYRCCRMSSAVQLNWNGYYYPHMHRDIFLLNCDRSSQQRPVARHYAQTSDWRHTHTHFSMHHDVLHPIHPAYSSTRWV